MRKKARERLKDFGPDDNGKMAYLGDHVRLTEGQDRRRLVTTLWVACGVATLAVLGASRMLRYSYREEIERNTCYFRMRRKDLPKGRSMGCVFVNPEGESAGELIDRCGLKGARIGGAFVSSAHANFIISDGGSSADVSALIAFVRKQVYAQTGVLLREEIRRIV